MNRCDLRPEAGGQGPAAGRRRPETLARLLLIAVAAVAIAVPAAQEKKDDKKWDVAEPLGPTTKLEFETSEGTWINVDVSPDGRRIVFDLLGDLYVMPIAGSGRQSATRLTSGLAYDMQPRFSPDGKRVAFSSDRAGLWNIWVMDADGKNAKQVSKESRWFINSPTWSPDGQYIFARRHFVKERSLGAGEIWMFHASGAEGLQVTEKSGGGRRMPASLRCRRTESISTTAKT